MQINFNALPSLYEEQALPSAIEAKKILNEEFCKKGRLVNSVFLQVHFHGLFTHAGIRIEDECVSFSPLLPSGGTPYSYRQRYESQLNKKTQGLPFIECALPVSPASLKRLNQNWADICQTSGWTTMAAASKALNKLNITSLSFPISYSAASTLIVLKASNHFRRKIIPSVTCHFFDTNSKTRAIAVAILSEIVMLYGSLLLMLKCVRLFAYYMTRPAQENRLEPKVDNRQHF